MKEDTQGSLFIHVQHESGVCKREKAHICPAVHLGSSYTLSTITPTSAPTPTHPPADPNVTLAIRTTRASVIASSFPQMKCKEERPQNVREFGRTKKPPCAAFCLSAH